MDIRQLNIKGYDQESLAEALDRLGIENESGLVSLTGAICNAVRERKSEISSENTRKLLDIYAEHGLEFLENQQHRFFHVVFKTCVAGCERESLMPGVTRITLALRNTERKN